MATSSDELDFSDLQAQAEQLLEIYKEQTAELQKQAQVKHTTLSSSPMPDTIEGIKKETAAKKEAILIDGQLTQKYKDQLAAKQLLSQLSSVERQNLKEASILGKAAADSYAAQSIELKKLNEQYKLADQATREKLSPQILALNNNLKKMDATLGVHSRNVGNYANSIRDAAMKVGGLTGIMAIFGRMVGINTEQLQALHEIHSTLREGSRDLSHLTHQHSESLQEEAAVTTEASEAQEAALGPLGIAIAAFTVLVGILALVSESSARARKEQESYSKAVDGAIILDKAVRDEHNETIETNYKTALSWKVMAHEISQTEATMMEASLSYKIAMSDIENETNDKLTKAGKWYHKFYNQLKDMFVGQGGIGKQLLSFETLGFLGNGDSQKREIEEIEQKKKEDADKALAALKEAQQKEIDALAEEHKRRLLEEADFNSKMSALKNEQIKDNYDKESKAIQNERELEIKKVGINSKGDKGYDDEQIARIKEEASQKQDNLDKELVLKALDRQRDYNSEMAELSHNKVAIATADYWKQGAELEKTLHAAHASEEEIAEALDLLHQKYVQTIVEIKRAEDAVWDSITKLADENIKDSSERQKRLIQDDFNTANKKWKQALADDEDNKVLKEQYDAWLIQETQKTNDAINEIELKAKEKTQKMQDENKKMGAKNQSDYDKNHPTYSTLKDLKTQLNDSKNEAQIDFGTKLDNVNSEEKDLLRGRKWTELNGEELKQYKALEDKKAEITQEYYNKIDSLDKEYRAKVAEALIKQQEEGLHASEQILNTENQLKEQSLKEQTDLIQNQAQVQAELAAAGRKNTLAQTMAAENKAAEDALKQQRAVARQKEAIELANLFITAEGAFIKGGDSPTKAAAEAMGAVLLAKGLAAGLAGSFFEGTPDTGGPGRLDNKGGMLAVLHPHEAVIPKARNEEFPGLAKAWITGNLDTYLAKISMPEIHGTDMKRVEQELGEIKNAIINQPQRVVYEQGGETIIDEKSGDNRKRIIVEQPIRLSIHG